MPLFRFLQNGGAQYHLEADTKTHRTGSTPLGKGTGQKKKIFFYTTFFIFYFILFKLGRLMRLQHGPAPLLAGEKRQKIFLHSKTHLESSYPFSFHG